MKSSKVMFPCYWLGIMGLAIILLAVPIVAKLQYDNQEQWDDHIGRIGRSLAGQMTCDKYPRVCRAKGSSGPDCCNKQCVNVTTDKQNCGKCGKKCSYSEICCQGKCVNLSVDEYHCGRCNHACKSGSSCVYGLCSYA